LISSENRVKPAALSTASTEPEFQLKVVKLKLGHSLGVLNACNGILSSMLAFGKTNAPAEISGMSGVEGEDGRVVSTTLAKCVGTATLGGDPITSCVYFIVINGSLEIAA
jgi:hypothetical protein